MSTRKMKLPPLTDDQKAVAAGLVPMATRMARAAYRRARGLGVPVDLHELESRAAFGAMRAARKCLDGEDLEKYAHHCIRGEIKDAFRYSKANGDARKAARNGLEFHNWDFNMGDSSGRPVPSYIDKIDLDDVVELPVPCILTSRERELLTLRFKYDWELEQIAEALGVTRSRVSQMLSDILARIRKEMA